MVVLLFNLDSFINNVVKQLQSISKLWFKKNDKYDELYNRIHEFAYGLLD